MVNYNFIAFSYKPKSPLEKVSTQVSVLELEKMRKIANVNYAGIDNETILRNFITRVLNGK